MLRGSVCAVLLLSPLPFGSVEPWAVLAVELAAAACGALAIVVASHDDDPLTRTGKRALWATAAIVAIGVLQLVPLPEAVARVLAPSTAPIRFEAARAVGTVSGWVPISLEPQASLDALLRFVSYALLAYAAAVAVRRPRHLRQIALVLAIAGGFQALYGSTEYLSGRQHIFGYAKRYYNDEASGTFINRNHFAGYLAMVLPVTLALVVDGLRGLAPARGLRERVLTLASRHGQRFVLGSALAGLIWIGIVLSYSRSGFAVALVGVALVVLRSAARRRRAWIVAAVLAVPTLFLLAQEVRTPGARFAAGEAELASLHGRLPVWRAAGAAVPGHLPLGSGFGTFGGIFPVYQPAGTAGHWQHAHNDWLETLLEGGPLVTACAVLLLLLVVGRTIGRVRSGPVLLVGVGAGLVVLALHAAIDFPMRIPAVAAAGACLAGMACAPVSLAARGGNRRRRGRRDLSRRPWSSVA